MVGLAKTSSEASKDDDSDAWASYWSPLRDFGALGCCQVAVFND